MNRFVKIFLFILVLNVFNPLLNAILRSYELPAFLSILRDVGIVYLFLTILINRYKNAIVLLPIMIVFSVVYLFQAILQGEAGIGFYYLRVYLMPILFLSICGYIYNNNLLQNNFFKFFIKFLVFTYITSIIVVILFYTNRPVVMNLYSLRGISGAWLLQGAKIFRAGWPIGGPNQLGVFTAASILFLILTIKSKNILSVSWKYIALILSCLILLMTFSRSSWIFTFLIVFGYFLFVVGNINRTLLISGTVIFGLGIATLFIFFSEPLVNWLDSTFNMTDASGQAHMTSLQEGIEKLSEYVLFGYPKGTVGPRSYLFHGGVNHVENTFLLYLMDFGIFIALIYFTIIGAIFIDLIRTRVQLVFVLSLFVPFMLLPYGQDIETLINLTFYLTAIGILFKRKEAV